MIHSGVKDISTGDRRNSEPSTVCPFFDNWSNEFFATNSTSDFFLGQMFLGVGIRPIQFAKYGLVRRVSPATDPIREFPNGQFLGW